MSDQQQDEEQQELQLSAELVRDIQQRIRDHDSRAQDSGVCAQYLAAVTGFMLGQLNVESAKKKQFLHQLQEFAAGVVDEVEAQQELQGAQPAGGGGDDEPASGIWTPDKG